MTALYILYGLFLVVLLLKCITMHKQIEDLREMMLQMKKDAYEDAKTELELLSKHLDSHSDWLHILDDLQTRMNELEEQVDSRNYTPGNLMDLPLEETRYRDYSKEDEPCE